jgi:hypothetical protein
MTRAKWTATLMLSLTFLVGALSGMALEEAAGIDWFDFLDDDESSVSDLRLMAGVDLSDEQRATVDRILERQEDELEDYWEERMPDIKGILSKSYAEIRVLLTPPQQSVFDQRVRELDGKVPEEFQD